MLSEHQIQQQQGSAILILETGEKKFVATEREGRIPIS
jgi:hypothetical protein